MVGIDVPKYIDAESDPLVVRPCLRFSSLSTVSKIDCLHHYPSWFRVCSGESNLRPQLFRKFVYCSLQTSRWLKRQLIYGRCFLVQYYSQHLEFWQFPTCAGGRDKCRTGS